MAKTYNWQGARESFLNGETLRKIVDKFKIPYGTITKRCADEGWRELRKRKQNGNLEQEIKINQLSAKDKEMTDAIKASMISYQLSIEEKKQEIQKLQDENKNLINSLMDEKIKSGKLETELEIIQKSFIFKLFFKKR